MASKRRASLNRRDFIPFIFGDEPITLSLCLPIYTQLLRDPGHVSRIITDDDLMLQLLSNFELYAYRIAKFFTLLNRNAVSRARQGVRRMSYVGPGIADELIENFLLPLLGEDFQQFQLHPAFLDLFAAVIDFCLPYHPRPLEALVKRLQENEALFGALVAGLDTSAVMKEWIGLFKATIFDTKLIGGWTRRLIAQCKRCESDHNIPDQIDMWRRLEDLIGRLTSIIHTSGQHAIQSSGVPDEGTRSSTTTGALVLPPDVKEALQYFRIEIPFPSKRVLTHILETLEKDETLRVLLATVKSFPCRPCYETSTDPSATKVYERYEQDDWGSSGEFMFTDILGVGIGVWRVLVSALAMKDMEDAHIQGDFNQIESKLVQLASGNWLDNSLCERIGRSTLCLAKYAGNGGILWQTDIEFDEGSDRTKQLVKIWRIGDVTMVLKAVRHVLFIHKTYPPTRLDACNHVLIDRVTGMNVPASFGGEFGIDLATTDRAETMDGNQDGNPAETLFRNKFYLVTQSTIDNLLSGNTTCEYPLTLAKEELDIIKNSTTSTLILGRSGTGKTTCLVYKLLGRYIFANRSGTGRQKRQVLLTRSSVLSDKLEVYTKRLISTQLSKGEPTAEDGENPRKLIGRDDREVHDTVFSIKEHDFPLVCTFNHFMKILENTARAANRKDFSIAGSQYQSRNYGESNPRKGSRRAKKLVRRPQIVDFEVFSGEYWPSFPTKLTKTISPTLVFMEIIGVIKGSACRFGKFSALTRDEYRQDGYKISPVTVDRDIVYDLYQHYEKRKGQHSDVDDIDRARSVLEAILNNPELKQRIEGAFDEIYVDEIQDQRLLEIMMLLHLIKSPNSIHFGGDTAQAISKDSVFRFAHLKDLVYQRFQLGSLTKPYELYRNYRTHQGIISVATCVMRQLVRCFPQFVDRLPDEVGQFSGPKPTVFVGFDEGVFSSRMFGAANLDDDDAQFGAEQVIIVRDFAEKKKLKDAIGDFALILTVMESKGMEFEDVLLYNFLTTSTSISDFRVLAGLVDTARFDQAKHIALCSELKQLYVAITRAQNRLWFFEENSTNLAPMLSLWMGKDPLVEVAHIEDGNIKDKLMKLRPGTNANPEVWSAKGYEFILKKDHENALFCFGRAKDSVGKSLANAFIAEKKGNALLSSGDEDLAEECFHKAIDLFHTCGYPLREAACYETLNMPEKAADLFSEGGEFGRAGDLYNKLDMFKKASLNYSRARRYNDGASVLARGNLFDDLVYYLNDHGYRLDSARHLHYSRLCNLLLKRGKISPYLRELTLAALRSDTEKEEFFKEFGMVSPLLAFYISKGRYSDACSLVIKDGNLDKAWEIDEKYGGMNKLSQQQRADVFNHTQAKHLLASLATEPDLIFLPDAHWSAECPWLSDDPFIPDFWGSLQERLNELLAHSISYESIRFTSKWMKQIFDLIVVLKSTIFINSAMSVPQLPIDSINEVSRMANEMIATRIIPMSLTILLRISLLGQDVESYLILESSPLRAGPDTPPSDTEGTVRAAIRWTLGLVCQAVDEVDDKANLLYSRAEPCGELFAKGKLIETLGACRWLGRCRNNHEQITRTEYANLMTDVLRINSIFCHLVPLYHKRFGELGRDGFSQTFRPRLRRWLERLLTRITYVSSLENDPLIIVDARRQMSQVNSPHFGAFNQLQEVLFYKLKSQKEWDFSFVLEQLQVAETLRLRPSFMRSLGFMARWMSQASRNSWQAVQRIELSLQFGINGNSVKVVDTELKALGPHEFYSYHAICSLYESMATFLIYKSHPTDFLLPNSWVELYLLQNVHLFTVHEPGTPQGPKTQYQEALLSLVESFCDLTRKINADSRFNPRISGRSRRWELDHKVFIRRNVDFLVCCTLNAFSWQTFHTSQSAETIALHLKYNQMRFGVSQVLGSAFARSPEFLACWSDYNVMARKFVNSLNNYAGKDGPRLIKASRNTVSFFAFLESSVQTTFLETLQSMETPPPGPALNEQIPAGESESVDYIQTILPAVKTIQRVWDARHKIIRKRREFFESPSGQAILYMQRICKAGVNGESLDRKEKIWRKGIHLSEGLNVYFYIKAVEELYQEKKAEVQTRIDTAEAGEMETFQLQWGRVLAMRERVSRSEDVLSEPNWHELDLPSQDLSRRYQQVLGDLKILEMDLGMVDCSERDVSAAEIIQNMWRTRYPIVQKRRVFFNTPSGQAISYMFRMYKSAFVETPLDRKERIQYAAVLFREGLEIYEYVRAMERLYLMAKNTIRSRVRVSHGAGAKRARQQWERVLKIRHQVRRNAGFLSEKNWKEIDISSRELRKRCSETLAFLKSIKDEIHDMIDDDDYDDEYDDFINSLLS